MDQNQEAKAINTAFDDCSIAFKGERHNTLARFKNNGERVITFDEDGVAWTKYDSEILPLADALRRYAIDHQTEVDRRTLPRDEAVSGRPALQSKADYATAAAKSAYIAQNGIEAWEALPLRTPQTTEVVYREDFFALPTAEKARRIAADPEIVSKLPNKPREKFAEVQARIEAAKSRHARELYALQSQQLAASNQGKAMHRVQFGEKFGVNFGGERTADAANHS